MEQKPRVIVITGANKGIGFETARGLVKSDSKPIVVVTSRNETLGREAVKKLADEFPSSKESIYYHVLDITKKETYKPFVDWIESTFGKFDVLVNNAGTADQKEVFGQCETTLEIATNFIGTNYKSTREFTEYILPYLSSDGKIISVSSTHSRYSMQGKTLHKKFMNPEFKPKDLDEIYDMYLETAKNQNFEEAGMTTSSYKVSKALINAWTYHVLRNSLKGDQQAFTMNPGWCRTDLGGPNAAKSPEEGIETILYLIKLPYKQNPETNGKFFVDNQVVDFE